MKSKSSFRKFVSLSIALFLVSVWIVACTKYSENKPIPNASYLRVFNSLTYDYSLFTKNTPSPFLVFLFDPVFDKDSVAINGKFVGDYLDQRDLFSASFAANAGNVATLSNKDFPGPSGVITAPPINGFDLSAWAAVPSGRHRLFVIGRPKSDTSFFNLPSSAKNSVVADTTLVLEPGEVYTAEAVTFDEGSGKTGWYIRKEIFTKQAFSATENYFSIFNLSAYHPLDVAQVYYPFADSLNFYYSEFTSSCGLTGNQGDPVYHCTFNADSTRHNVYFRSVVNKFQRTAPFDSLPEPSVSEFLNPDDTYKEKGNRPIALLELYQGSASPLTANASAYIAFSDYYNYNNAAQQLGWQNAIQLKDGFGQTPPIFSELLPSLTLSTSNGHDINPTSTVNIVELVNDRVFLMQINKSFQPPQN